MVELSINIKSEEKKYSVFIEDEPLDNLKSKILSYVEDKRFFVVVSEKVYKLYKKYLDFERENIFILKDGESQKNLKNYAKIMNKALKLQLTRKSAIVAVGGGVCGDLAGFVASTYMRGIDFIQVPTTLLACVDSSVGGKTAINTDFGKNLVGAFYQPKVVLINTNFLKTIDERQFKSGLGEVVKYSFIEKSCNAREEFNLFNYLNENREGILKRDSFVLKDIIEICIKLKFAVVEQDEKENGLRKLLNFGHTYAHAVETVTKYKKYTHGEAVVCGIYFVFNLALKLNKIEKNYKFLAEDMLNKFEFKKVKDFPLDKMIKLMHSDKKASSKEISFVLPCEYARAETVYISDETLFECFK